MTDKKQPITAFEQALAAAREDMSSVMEAGKRWEEAHGKELSPSEDHYQKETFYYQAKFHTQKDINEKLKAALRDITLKFESGNAVPVTRAQIDIDKINQLLAELD